ncbi:MAG: hypothetical protein WAX69_12995 [Victivallales bacterium]
MIKKLFILSAIILACAGCWSPKREFANTYNTVPYICVYPNCDYNVPKLENGLSFLCDYAVLYLETGLSISGTDGTESYSCIRLEPSNYEPIYRFVDKDDFESNYLYDDIKNKIIKHVDCNNVPFREIVDWIVKQAQVSIVIRMNPSEIDKCRAVTIKCENIGVLDLLDRICRNEGLFFKITSRAIVIKGDDYDYGVYYMNSVTSPRIFGKDASPKDIRNKLLEFGIYFEELEEKIILSDPYPYPRPRGSISFVDKIPSLMGWGYKPFIFVAHDSSGGLRLLERSLDVQRILVITNPEYKEEEESGTSEIKNKLEDIIIAHVEYEDVKVSACVADLSRRFKENDPEKRGMDIQLVLDVACDYNGGVKVSDQNEPVITIVVDDISVGDAIRFICRAANLKYKIYKNKIVIANKNVPFYPLETRSYPVLDPDIIENKLEVFSDNGKMDKIEFYFRVRNVSFVKGTKVSYDDERKLLDIVQTAPEFKRMQPAIAYLCGYRTKFIFDKSSPVAAKIANLKPGDFVEVKGEMQIKEAKFNGYPFPQPCFLIKDIEAIRNPVLPKLRKYEPAQ